jgi:hypothetical protein
LYFGNSTIGAITQKAQRQTNNLPIEISSEDGIMQLHESDFTTQTNAFVQMKISASSASAIASRAGHSNFWCLDRDLVSGDRALILSDTNSSIVNIPETNICCWLREGSRADCTQLHRLLVFFLVENTLSGIESQLWVHGATGEFALALIKAAEKRKIDVFPTTSEYEVASKDIHFIHPYIAKRNLEKLRPTNVEAFVN